MADNTVAERVRNYRQGLRNAGLRPIQIWVPDTRTPGFVEECLRQSRIVADGVDEGEMLDFIEQVGDWNVE
ncbi:antitoxin MazE family protein [Caballeronia calidae]|uniref:antitoxin MazE family protein n=1 Tax=Caballeronia calidae TaxID=1777139 RepID=UPI0009413C36|nr:antitoxin MazE family protein [Caballeronia calidae]